MSVGVKATPLAAPRLRVRQPSLGKPRPQSRRGEIQQHAHLERRQFVARVDEADRQGRWLILGENNPNAAVQDRLSNLIGQDARDAEAGGRAVDRRFRGVDGKARRARTRAIRLSTLGRGRSSAGTMKTGRTSLRSAPRDLPDFSGRRARRNKRDCRTRRCAPRRPESRPMRCPQARRSARQCRCDRR